MKLRSTALALAFVGIALSRVGSGAPHPSAWEPTCAAVSNVPLRWVRTSSVRERPSLDRWCAGVGLPARTEGTRRAGVFTGSFAIVSWNTHIGGGDIDRFVRELESGKLTGQPVSDYVLLLQEVYRAGGNVPTREGVAWAAAEIPATLTQHRTEVVAAAERLGLWAVYVPSMRNGKPGATAEDRGNAILSTRPITDVTAIELPLERQRRVALGGSITFGTYPIRVVCTHFTNMVMHHLWVLSESGRLRQARSLRAQLPSDGPLVIGGDFNSWFGFRDAAYRELAQGMANADKEDRRATFGPLRLDHLLFRLPPGWHTELRRGDSKFGSDHYPLIATITTR